MARFAFLHDWNFSPREAVTLQRELASRVLAKSFDGHLNDIKFVAGCDVSFDKFSPQLFAGIVVLRFPEMEVVEEVGAMAHVEFPYVPGLLSFREIPPLLEAWRLLKHEPDAVLFDGQGIAHPRRMGLACHAGLFLDRPCVGCAKSKLVGDYAPPGETRGSWSPMTHRGEIVGAALRTKNKTNEMFISPGHKIDLANSIALTLACTAKYRMPEPTRRAHLLVNALRRGERAVDF
jgi:deoxyribonuclease V